MERQGAEAAESAHLIKGIVSDWTVYIRVLCVVPTDLNFINEKCAKFLNILIYLAVRAAALEAATVEHHDPSGGVVRPAADNPEVEELPGVDRVSARCRSKYGR